MSHTHRQDPSVPLTAELSAVFARMSGLLPSERNGPVVKEPTGDRRIPFTLEATG